MILQRRENLEQIINCTRKRCIVNGRTVVSCNERRERKGIPFQPRFRDRTKAGQFKQLSASQSGRQKPCSGCLRNRIDETVFQAVRSPGNINYKRKEQWKSFHPRLPSSPVAATASGALRYLSRRRYKGSVFSTAMKKTVRRESRASPHTG